jgi:hypothetical protein
LPDAITTAIATAVAGSAAQSLTAQASRILAEITNRLRYRFRERHDDLTALVAARDEPASSDKVAGLAESLHRIWVDDPAFGREIMALWRQYQVATGNVTNNFQGQAENVVQLRDIHGDLNIG